MKHKWNDKLLIVEGVGEFWIEWHLSVDMKSIVCTYGLKHGANSLQSCSCCLLERSRPIVRTTQACRNIAKETCGDGLFARGVSSKLVELQDYSRWRYVFPIPLSWVHICTLHAQVRMLEQKNYIFVLCLSWICIIRCKNILQSINRRNHYMLWALIVTMFKPARI